MHALSILPAVALIDLVALRKEVKKGRLRCALDVTDPQEPLFAADPLRTMQGAIITPHIAGSGQRVREEIAGVVLDDLNDSSRQARRKSSDSFNVGPDDVNGIGAESLILNPRLSRLDDVANYRCGCTVSLRWRELRFVQGEDSLWKLPCVFGKGTRASQASLADHGLTISCLDTSCRFHSPDATERDVGSGRKTHGGPGRRIRPRRACGYSVIRFSPVPTVIPLKAG